MAAKPIAEQDWELCYTREWYENINTRRFTRHADLDVTLAKTPKGFVRLIADYKTVMLKACELNEAQRKSGFLHYLFFPDLPL